LLAPVLVERNPVDARTLRFISASVRSEGADRHGHDEIEMKYEKADELSTQISRRTAIGAFGVLGSVLWTACTNTSSDHLSADASVDSSSGSGSGTCAATPEGEIGPYFADDSATGFNRSDIRSNLDGTETQSGVPLTLTLYVYDSENSCAAYANAQVDVWHCNASGVYSDIAAEQTSSSQWLRGYQITDSAGKVTFTTVVPGWYQGRTTHIHVRIRSSYSEASSTSDGTNTTQVFFSQTLVDSLATTVAPYSSEGKNTTTNASDHVYTGETNGETLMALTGDATNGFAATFAIYLPIAAATSGSDHH
jgi:protocatechuate 3,4-dioxygenase beta subunit